MADEDGAGGRPIDRLLAVMTTLRDPACGCPWDREQTFRTIAPYTIEEAYEVADAIGRGDTDALKEELGDLLLQVVFHAQMAREEGLFGFEDVAAAIADKMVRRHPHVFSDGAAQDAAAVRATWEEIKAAERSEKAARRGAPAGADDPFADVPVALPALTRALKIQKTAARLGFDWTPDEAGAVALGDKLAEELGEFAEALSAGEEAHAADEFGDLLFTLVNLARWHRIDAEAALRRTTDRFIERIGIVRQILAEDNLSGADAVGRLDAAWEEAKRRQRAAAGDVDAGPSSRRTGPDERREGSRVKD